MVAVLEDKICSTIKFINNDKVRFNIYLHLDMGDIRNVFRTYDGRKW